MGSQAWAMRRGFVDNVDNVDNKLISAYPYLRFPIPLVC